MKRKVVEMCNRKRGLACLGGIVACLMLAVAVKQDVRAEEKGPEGNYRVCTEDTKLYVEPDWTGKIAGSIQRDGVMELIGEEGFYTKVRYRGVEGYLDTQFVSYDEKLIEAYEEELRLEAEREEQRIAAELEAQRLAAEQEAQRIAAELEAQRLAAEQEAQRIAAEQEAQRLAAELEAQRIAAELEAQRVALELLARSEEIRIMAAMIQCEAGNQPFEGQVAVGAVIMNRVKSAAYPNTIVEVLLQPKQFSPVDDELFAELLANDTIKQSCRDAALQAFLGVDNVNGAMHFRRAGNREGIVIGDHVFW